MEFAGRNETTILCQFPEKSSPWHTSLVFSMLKVAFVFQITGSWLVLLNFHARECSKRYNACGALVRLKMVI